MTHDPTHIEQRSEEWRAARCGLATASRMCDIMARTKSGYSASRASYMAQLIVERLTGKPSSIPPTRPMQQGTEREPQARASYELFTGHEVQETGFHIHPRLAQSGASPDGLVGAQGLVEIKCPQPTAHLDILIGQKIPRKYQLQMQWQMACTGRKWCDFISFNPDFPDDFAGLIIHLPRDDGLIAKMEVEVETFLHELEQKMQQLDHIKNAIRQGKS